MKNRMLWVIVWFVAVGLFSGCESGKPNHEDVKTALEVVKSGFEAVPPFREHMMRDLVFNEYVRGEFENSEFTIRQKADYYLNRDEGHVEADGFCSFEEYEDAQTGYLVNGSIDYNFFSYFDEREFQRFEMVFDLKFEGGKVTSIYLVMDLESVTSGEPREVLVNGEKFDTERKPGFDLMAIVERGIREVEKGN